MKEHAYRFNRDMTRAVLDRRKWMTRRPIKPQPPSREWFLKKSGQDIGFYKPREWELGWRMSGSVGIARDEMGDKWPQDHFWYCPYGQKGDTFRLSEAVNVRAVDHERYSLLFEADLMHTERYGTPELMERIRGYKRGMLRGCTLPPAFCRSQRWEITEVRVERVQSISYCDLIAEGIEPDWDAFHQATEDCEGWEEPEEFIEECEDECDYVNFGNDLVHSTEHKEWLRERDAYARKLAFKNIWQSIYGQESWANNDWVWVIAWKGVKNG